MLNWLRDPDERAFVWERCLPSHGQTLRFPVLMCSEDIDLSCHLVVVDVSSDSEYVYWHRMGAGCSGFELPRTGDDLGWADWEPIRFRRGNYTDVLDRYRVYLDGSVDGVVYPPAEGERVETYEIHDRNSAPSGG
ncbi:hypothetical protein [Rhodopirellula sp. SWK7]|uniref:hypothetical protein n=1 Tax=Rhodopirellula sp. SWK7 TaxID=595460 RepID=UPI001360B249|nr:hypothetical protein [Rhodopirellula sp. SWK7]